MSENKYNKYVSQKPTDGDPSTRAFKRRSWKSHWQNFLKSENIIFEREIRRLSWKDSWVEQFRDMDKKVEPVVSNA
jgi:hypothetical protein